MKFDIFEKPRQIYLTSGFTHVKYIWHIVSYANLKNDLIPSNRLCRGFYSNIIVCQRMSNYMSNYLTSCQIIVILCQILCQIIWHRYIKFQYFYFYFFQTPTRGIFKGDFHVLRFLFCRIFENWHTKKALVRSESFFSNINKNCCFLKKGGMSQHLIS